MNAQPLPNIQLVSYHVDKPHSMPDQMFRFMIGQSQQRSFSCMLKVNDVGLKRLQSGEELRVGSKKVNHIVENFCTVRDLTRQDLEAIYSITGPRTTIDDGKKTHHYKVTSHIDWIDRFDAPQRVFPLG